MPQMGPLLWLNLFLMFILGYMLFSIINFFSKLPIKTETFVHKSTLLEKFWKW
uniref:ATP synthase F0 subunit 8 n=1 Tax=Cherax holthuisi TaxID=1552322 RepID=A0A0B4ZVH9_9EUCA|nr:ATP synthase F0 subunit 8 [Cherax holthuisi]AJD80476.1 ATP synthase F0 subunit 8 [Cherax holthuisi]